MNQLRDALRPHVRKCWPKEQCATKGSAKAQMRSILRRGLEKDASTIHVYLCPFCRTWHVGHDRFAAKPPETGSAGIPAVRRRELAPWT